MKIRQDMPNFKSLTYIKDELFGEYSFRGPERKGGTFQMKWKHLKKNLIHT